MRAALKMLFAGFATFILMGFGQSLYGPTLPEATRIFRLPEGTAALLVTAQWVGSALGVVMMYFNGHRIVPRHALAVLAIGASGLAAQPGWWAMLVASLVFGMGYGMAAACFNPRVLLAFGRKGPSVLNQLNAAFAVGAIVGPLVFVWVGGASATVFWLVAGVSAVVWVFAEDGQSKAMGPRVAPQGQLRPHWPILAFGAVGVGIEACLIGLGPTALIAAGETEAAAARYLSAFFLAFLAARIVLGFMAHLVQAFHVYVLAMLCALLCIGCALFWAPGPAFVAMGIAGGMLFPSYFLTAARKMGDDPRVTPLTLGAGLVGGIGMPYLLANLVAGFGERGFFVLLAGLVAPTLALALLQSRRMAA